MPVDVRHFIIKQCSFITSLTRLIQLTFSEHQPSLRCHHLHGAIKWYDKALAVDPNDVDALNNKKNALEKKALG
jgi:hypothetical protein